MTLQVLICHLCFQLLFYDFQPHAAQGTAIQTYKAKDQAFSPLVSNRLICGTNASKIGHMIFWVSNSIHPLEQIQDSIELHASIWECSNILFIRKLEFILNVHNWVWMGNTCSATKNMHLILPSWVHKVIISNMLHCTDSGHTAYTEILCKTAKDRDSSSRMRLKSK